MTIIKRALITAVKIYAVALSPLFANTCRFQPSCSAYMMEAIEMHGVWRGVWLGLKRLSKCHPWHRCETLIDPVPKVRYKPNHE